MYLDFIDLTALVPMILPDCENQIHGFSRNHEAAVAAGPI
jgi:hypothetical protein